MKHGSAVFIKSHQTEFEMSHLFLSLHFPNYLNFHHLIFNKHFKYNFVSATPQKIIHWYRHKLNQQLNSKGIKAILT